MNMRFRFRMGMTVALTTAMFVGAAQAQDAEPSQIDTATGTVMGVSLRGLESWLGIPYAKPPVGPLRWQPPQPVEPWTAPIKANTISSSCAQNTDLGPFAKAGGNEDCLYLNVYRSAEAARSGERLPVFVWIHGGALQVGQGADYDPSKMAATGKAIVVTLN